MPSPLSINRFADKVLEEGLKEMEKEELIDQGYKEFCENERKRFAAGAAGPNPRKLAKDYEALSQALNPRERETLPEAAKRLVAERDEALNQLANQPPPVIKEVIPPDLEGVREAFAELPPKLRKNLSIAQSISNIGSSLAEAEVAVENVDREIKLIKKEKERLEDQLKKERTIREIAEETAKKLQDQIKELQVFTRRLLKALEKPYTINKVVYEMANFLNIPIGGINKE